MKGVAMKNQLFLGIVLIFSAACARLFPHPPNVTPVIAMALVGGLYLDKRIGFVIPIMALLLSDLVLGFHGLMLYVYGSVLLVVILGASLQSRKSPATIVAGSLVSSILFFLITNAGVWLQGSGKVYPMTFDGLMLSYTMGIPFFRNALLGDLFFVALLSGLFEFGRKFAIAPNPSSNKNP